ncbi:hypothetical protein [Streptomyces sp. NPDC002328]|uniref:hypothetical protein n=1 Tax=Streptomyces sp. NPDC002328 TaxID=3364642 RepID=UPI0036CBDBB6
MAQSGLDLKIAAPGLAVVNSIENLGGFVSLIAVFGAMLIRGNGGGAGAGSGAGSGTGERAALKGRLATGEAR